MRQDRRVPGVALALLAAFGLIALVGRMLIQYRRTGRTGFAGVGAGADRLSAPFLVAGFVALGVGPALELGGDVDPIGALDRALVHAAGLGLAAGGIATTAVAQLAMGDAWRIGVERSERTQLVTDGPFGLVRNPIYAGMIPFGAGAALMAPNPVTIAGAALVLGALEVQTRFVEEPHLLNRHGDEYARYAARVGRFVPGVGRLR